VIGRNLIPLLREHDGDQFDIFCYSDVLQPDQRTAQFRSYTRNWRNIVGWSNEKVAEVVRADRIDILVDLAMHLERNRLLVFAQKPAPIQLSFAAYPGGVGSSLIDYRLTDPYLDPPGAGDSDSREKSYRLPSSFWCYDAEAITAGLDFLPEPGPLPALRRGAVTFGYLGNTRKIHGGVLQLWAKVMQRVENSRLLLLAPEGAFRRKVWEVLTECGVSGERVEFASIQPLREYLQLYQRIDIGLDSFPYNGHTTSLDALWMGVPVVTLAGATAVGRAGVSHSMNLGTPELIGHSAAEYIEIAVGLAGDLPRLGEIRANLRRRLEASPIGDAKGFAREIEGAYRAMWREWCKSRH
jgi:predicted O-linked N-acetylglucosamine transferase (SPINDLY family)